MTGFTAVLLYAIWTLLLPIFYASYRAPLILGGRKRADHWERGKPVDDPPLLAPQLSVRCQQSAADDGIEQ